MAIAVTNPYKKTNSTSIPAYNSGTAANSCLVVVHICFNASPTAISYGSKPMTLVDSQLDGDSWGKTFLYYLMNPPTGSNSFSITGGTTANEAFFAATLTGVNTNEIGGKSKASGDSAIASSSLTPVATGNLIIFGVSSGTATAVSALGGSTLINTANNTSGGAGMLSLPTTGNTPQTVQATMPNDFWTIVAAEFKAAGTTTNTGQFFQLF